MVWTWNIIKGGNCIVEKDNRDTLYYTYNELNQLVKGTRGPDYGLYKREYTYNGLGIRVNSTIEGPEHTYSI